MYSLETVARNVSDRRNLTLNFEPTRPISNRLHMVFVFSSEKVGFRSLREVRLLGIVFIYMHNYYKRNIGICAKSEKKFGRFK